MSAGVVEMSRIRLSGEDAAVNFFAPAFTSMDRESLYVAHLDADRRLIGMRLHYSDYCDSVEFPLRTIIRDALYMDSAGLLLAHNHPSGDPSPSRRDLIATRALVALVKPLGVRIYDHLIFAGMETRSLFAMGLL